MNGTLKVADKVREKMTGETATVKAIDGLRAKLLNHETGSCEWVMLSDLQASWTLLEKKAA